MLEKLETCLQNALSLQHITLEDQGYFHRGHHPDRKGGHFALTLVSSDFENLNTIKRHQKVYQALGMPKNPDIHAMSLETYTPNEWQDKKENTPSS